MEFDFILEISTFKTDQAWGMDPYAPVNSKVKSAFTKQFNKSDMPIRTSLMLEGVKKVSKKSSGNAAAESEAALGLGGEDPEMEETVAKLKEVSTSYL